MYSKAAQRVSIIVFIFLSLLCVIPLLLVITSSFTSEKALYAHGYSLIPSELSFGAYQYLWASKDKLLRSYLLSFVVTGLGTFGSIAITTLFAYPLSNRELPGRNFFSFFVFFTMLFNGGIVPSYIMWTRIFHIKDTIWALLIPNYLVNAFNVILVKNYYTNNIPESLVEAAQIDGATEFVIFRRIMFPLAVPAVATISLFTGLCYWNDWTNGLYYVNNEKLYSIQMLLMKIMDNIQALRSNSNASLLGTGAVELPGTAIRMAMAVIGILPIVVIYPFVQKHFIKGVVLGAVKG